MTTAQRFAAQEYSRTNNWHQYCRRMHSRAETRAYATHWIAKYRAAGVELKRAGAALERALAS